MGFDWGDMAVERCFESKGRTCVRVRSIRTGLYVDVELSPRGKKMTVTKPVIDKRLAGYDPCGGKETFSKVYRVK